MFCKLNACRRRCCYNVAKTVETCLRVYAFLVCEF